MREGYQTTELGEIPIDWELIPLYELRNKKDRYSFTGGPFGSDLKSENYIESGVRVLQLQNIGEGQFIDKGAVYVSEEKADELNSCNIYPGEIILAKMAPVARCCKIPYFDKRFVMCSDGIRLSVDSERFDNEFVFQALNSNYFRKEAESQSTGSTRARIGLNDLKLIPIAFPKNKEEQQKIATILSTVDEKIDVIDEQITQTKELKKGLMQKLLTRGIGHSKFQNSVLGEIPEDWRVVKLGDLGVFSRGKGISKKELSESGKPCIRYGEIYTVHHIVVKNYHSFIPESIIDTTVKLKRNDILFAGSGETAEEIGKAVAFVGDEEVYAGGDIVIFSPFNIDSIFLSFCLNHEIVTSQRRKFGQGNSVVHIYARDLEKLLIPIPPILEQEKISEILSTIDQRIDILLIKKENYKMVKKGLMQQLLTGKVRVVQNDLVTA